jgi:antitoxin VapB
LGDNALPTSSFPQRKIRLFRINRNQTIQIPIEFELSGTEAVIHRQGNRLIIEPVPKQGLATLLDSWTPLEDVFPDIEDLPPFE